MPRVIVVVINDDEKREGLEPSQSSVSFDCTTAILNDVEVAKSLGANVHSTVMDI